MSAQPEHNLGPREFKPISLEQARLEPARPRPELPWRDRIALVPRKRIAIGVGVLLAIVAVLWAATRSSSPNAPAAGTAADQELPLVTVTRPEFKSVTGNVTFTGTISARYDMPIGTEGEGGRIVAVLVEAGDRVKKGQLLARLDQSVTTAQVNQLAATVDQAVAQAALSEAEYQRAKGVEAAGALSAEEIERRRAASLTDAARAKVAAAQLAESEARLGRTQIRAPSDGIVLTRTAEVGQTAMPGGEPLFRLASGSEIEMRGQIAEQDIAAVQVGQSANVYLTGIAEPFKGKVRLLGAVIDPKTRLGDIRIQLEPHPALRPGAFARAQVRVSEAERAVLPQTAVLADAQGNYVLIVNDKDETERRAVHVADTTAEGFVIDSGLKGDERVIGTAGGFLRAGEKVRVAQADAQQ
ncbi:MAG TPA: efflux RND transporter periplasmic adaptor subunit [Steroidobacteraceae bacterium]|nr:efflux RND transporter periplasmic adaptor subunit [Steroidobacteraceae bacterium]